MTPSPTRASAPAAPSGQTAGKSASRDSRFIAYLMRLVEKEDRAALAALRRGLGKDPGEASEMFPYVVCFLPTNAPWRWRDYFLMASLFALHQGNWGATTPTESTNEKGEEKEETSKQRSTSRNFGASFRWLANQSDSESIEKRFVALLNATREDLPSHLRHAVSLFKAQKTPVLVDWLQLLRDLGRWDAEQHTVQLTWAREYWRASAGNTITESEGEEAEASYGGGEEEPLP